MAKMPDIHEPVITAIDAVRDLEIHEVCVFLPKSTTLEKGWLLSMALVKENPRQWIVFNNRCVMSSRYF